MEDTPTNNQVINRYGIFPSDDERIRQAVDIGSIFLALESNFFTVESLLQWLATVPMTVNTQIAYKAVCTKISPNMQYLNDSWHFLTKKPEYTSIAIGFGFMTDIPDQKDSSNPLIAHICEALITINNDTNLRKLTVLILAAAGTESYIQSKLVTCLKARNFPHLRSVSAHEINIGLVAADWANKFRYNEKLPHLILHRVTELQSQAPLYYAEVAYKVYHKVVTKLNKDKLLTQLSREELIRLNTFFPNIIDQKILEYTDLAYKIALLGNDIAGYVLGFPIHNMIPNDEQIDQAIQTLISDGIDKYAERIKVYVVKTYMPILPFENSQEITFSNEQDVIMEDIDNYTPFDIVSYQAGSYIYRFTRAEFSKLLENKKNPWTNEWLPPTILSTIKSRVEAAKQLGFPIARPLRDMLLRVENGTLFQPDEIPKPTIQQNTNNRTNNEILNMLMTAAMMGQWYPRLPLNESININEMVPRSLPRIPVEHINNHNTRDEMDSMDNEIIPELEENVPPEIPINLHDPYYWNIDGETVSTNSMQYSNGDIDHDD